VAADKPEFIKPHIEIKEKAVFISEEAGKAMIEKAEKIVENMQDDYVEWSKKDVEKLKTILKRVKENPNNANEDINELIDLANDMKSQGGSFNYNLVTFIGNSLAKFLDEKQTIDDKAIETIQIHVDTIIMVLNRNMTGNGGQMGKEILDGIKAVVQKVLAQEQSA
jgi:gas vesicle protein